ncbi:unnamed protein product, partial [Meganyctiphanes norvegica]
GIFTTDKVSCYHCSSIHDDYDYEYDPECNSSHYHNTSLTEQGYTCRTVVLDDGNVRRFSNNDYSEDELCDYGDYWVGCNCFEQFCNSDLCEWCGSEPKTTTEALQTTTNTLTTTNDLRCYSCIDCAQVDDSTLILSSSDYQACSTSYFLLSGTVRRGASLDYHPDGECLDEGTTLNCFCHTDLCNDNVDRLMTEHTQK